MCVSVQARTKSTKINSLCPETAVWGVGFFHSKGWWSKSSFPPSKVCCPWVSKGGTWDVLEICQDVPDPRGVFKKFLQRSLCSFWGPYLCVCVSRLCTHISAQSGSISLLDATIPWANPVEFVGERQKHGTDSCLNCSLQQLGAVYYTRVASSSIPEAK